MSQHTVSTRFYVTHKNGGAIAVEEA